MKLRRWCFWSRLKWFEIPSTYPVMDRLHCSDAIALQNLSKAISNGNDERGSALNRADRYMRQSCQPAPPQNPRFRYEIRPGVAHLNNQRPSEELCDGKTDEQGWQSWHCCYDDVWTWLEKCSGKHCGAINRVFDDLAGDGLRFP
ncbi:hypothetical protein GCM10025778_14420 [Paeniglutamicibacter antarcticus]|uniref:Uncharacterized protein n=1 Tax=Paeniglutamicibacter antarcticus TaxID=494023 RepID=A0ABP9TJC9_9MICC